MVCTHGRGLQARPPPSPRGHHAAPVERGNRLSRVNLASFRNSRCPLNETLLMNTGRGDNVLWRNGSVFCISGFSWLYPFQK